MHCFRVCVLLLMVLPRSDTSSACVIWRGNAVADPHCLGLRSPQLLGRSESNCFQLKHAPVLSNKYMV